MTGKKTSQDSIPGRVVLFGSGETSPSGRKVIESLFRDSHDFPRVALLETPAGFELNSDRVIGRVVEFIAHHLQNYKPQMTTIPARKRGTAFSPDDPELCAPLLEATMIFMGPGSPTYTVRQLQNSLAWHYLVARHRLGADLVLSSAAVIAAGKFSLPVYEIFKVGEELHWKDGLDFFGLFGLPLIFVPHWNNNDGGEELDTSRCFMGQTRFTELVEMLPPDLSILGIDEHTTLTMDIQEGMAYVSGLGGVTIIHTGHEHSSSRTEYGGTDLAEIANQRKGHIHQYLANDAFPLELCCPFELPSPGFGVPPAIWQHAVEVDARFEIEKHANYEILPPPEVVHMATMRQEARARKDWDAADALRQRIFDAGWQMDDTPDGPQLKPL